MATVAKNYLDVAGLQAYDALIKTWANSANQKGYKTILKTADGNTLNLYKTADATLTDTPDATVALGGGDVQTQLNALASIVGVTYNSTSHKYSAALDSTFDSATDDLVDALNELKGQINTLNGDNTTTGSVAKAIKDAIDGLKTTADVTTATVADGVVTLTAGIAEENGVIKKGSGADITLAKVATTGKAEDIAITDTAEKITATNVEGALAELATKLENEGVASKVTVEEGGASGDILKSYSFYQGVEKDDDTATKEAKKLTTINIPKDYLVRSAEVKTVETADTPYSGAAVGDKYIDFTVNTKDGEGTGTATHLYVAINDLIHPISGSTGTEITVTVDGNNQIGATINKVASSKIVYKAADTEAGTAEVTVEGALNTINGEETVSGSIKEAKKSAIDTVVGTSSDDKDTDTVNGAKAYADDKVSGLTGSAAIASESGGVITIKGGVSESNGVVANNSELDDITISAIATADINALFS